MRKMICLILLHFGLNKAVIKWRNKQKSMLLATSAEARVRALYKIEIWQHYCITDFFESKNVIDLLGWYKSNWQYAYETGSCTFHVYKDNTELTFEEVLKLGFYV